jgi:UDP-N-acetylmuramoyl-tripeptide--D-alanyl-D-alanine ligase
VVSTASGKVTAQLSPADDGTLYACLATIAVGVSIGLTASQIEKHLKDLAVESRIRTTSSNGYILVDDTYNASIRSVVNGLDLIAGIGLSRIAILGDLREVDDHVYDYKRILEAPSAAYVNFIIAVGETLPAWKSAAALTGFDQRKLHGAQNWADAVCILNTLGLPEPIAVFVKGSRFSHLERVSLSISGRHVRCEKISCDLYIHCSGCHQL